MLLGSRLPVLGALGVCLSLGLTACDKDELPPDDSFADDDAGDSGSEGEILDMPAEAEACASFGDARDCADGGMQFCDMDDAIGLHWGECLLDYACIPGDAYDCGLGGTVACQLVDGTPELPECPWTPLALSFDGAPIQLSSSSATFDIDGTGMCLDTDWPASSNPWLAIDLDRNGFVDGAHELFGSGTILRSGRRASNGFVALEALDGNRDGKIDAHDARFTELLLWRDEDGDKQSTIWELTPLADERIESIDLGYTVREQCDDRSNCGRERSSFTFMAGGTRRVGEIVDVYLACQ
jgi:hypothetical protein